MKIWLVIPAFCEGWRLRRVVAGAKKFVAGQKTVVVDDGSIPPERVRGCVLLRHEVNLGKGAAMKTGADYAFAHGADAVIFMDADLQHPSRHLPTFIRLLKTGQDVVMAQRVSSLDMPLVRLLGNKLASIYINLVFGIYVDDLVCGYRGLSRRAYQKIHWASSRYGVETEMIARLGKHRGELKYTKFPIETIYIDKYKGVTIIDAVKILLSSLWWKLS